MTNVNDTIVSDVISKDIIDLLELSNLPQERQDEFRRQAEETIGNRTFSQLTDIVEEKGLLDEFQKVSENDTAIREFLTKNGIDLDAIIAEETVLYKAQMKTMNDLINTGISVKPSAN
jgi:hypothetical protein